MGGQACVLYGAAEFSRDTDFVLLADEENLLALKQALDSLQAERIAVPPFEKKYLLRGHSIHFRCRHPDVAGLRVDVMSVMRGVDDFEVLWSRRTTVEINPGKRYEVLSLGDLVQAKKTQRDKDWPMIRRLVESHYFQNRDQAADEQVFFWLRECRTASILLEIAKSWPGCIDQMTPLRPLLSLIKECDEARINEALLQEELRCRQEDRQYWLPLKKELETLRHSRQ